MTQETAERIVQALLSASAALNEALRLMEGETSAEVFSRQRSRTGDVMGAIYLDLIKPVVASYPQLDPGRQSDISQE
jgi:hypothetical protein